jgi:hypothetical protein
MWLVLKGDEYSVFLIVLTLLFCLLLLFFFCLQEASLCADSLWWYRFSLSARCLYNDCYNDCYNDLRTDSQKSLQVIDGSDVVILEVIDRNYRKIIIANRCVSHKANSVSSQWRISAKQLYRGESLRGCWRVSILDIWIVGALFRGSMRWEDGNSVAFNCYDKIF